ncbi:MAG: hydroxyacid dehydrogenase [Clostridia bacterium]|nr:hydroxyacid dehydrogenase [Clostridia bacterium]
MHKIVILDAETLGRNLSLDPILSCGEVKVFSSTAPEDRLSACRDAQIVLLNKVRLDRELLQACPNLKLICCFSTGYDQVDLECCRELGIGVCNVKGYSTESVAGLTVALASALVYHLHEYTDYVAAGSYSSGGVANHLEPAFHDFSGLVWGIVGYGHIGRRVAKAAKALGARVQYCRQEDHNEPGCVTPDELCATSDIISLHVPLNAGTFCMINRERIASMKQGSIVINVARGKVCDEEALVQALLSGRLGGIGVDVYGQEPFGKDSPWCSVLHHPRALLTPHMAWGSWEARRKCVEEGARNIRSFLSGGRRNRVD